jgi:7tm Chemosensory receptor
MMCVTAFELLRPALLVARFVGLFPCSTLDKKGRFRHSNPIFYASLSIVFCFFVPYTAYFLYQKFGLGEIFEESLGNIFSYCILFITLVHLGYGSLYSWHFVTKSCRMLRTLYNGVCAAEKILGRHKKGFRTQWIWAYQICAFTWEIVLCVFLFITFSTKGGSDWKLQLFFNITRMQIFVIEQLIVVVNVVLALKYQQVRQNLEEFHLREKYKKVICMAAVVKERKN